MSKSKSFREILTKPESSTSVETSIPARLLRELLARVGPTPMEWETMMDNYYKVKHGDDFRKIREEKTNLTSALEKDKLSWDRFEQAITILGPDKFKVTVELCYPRDLSVDTTITVRTGRRHTLGEVEEDDSESDE